MVSLLRKLFSRFWILFVVAFILFDLIIVAGFIYLYLVNQVERVAAAEIAQAKATPTPTATPSPTATLWPGPPPSPTPTATLPPTPEPTEVLAESGFPVGFTPTPRPTREPVTIRLPIVAPIYAGSVDVPVINQIHYPEPFFPPGTNNACGPVALFAALQALRIEVDYSHLRNVAVQNGFTHYGISKAGMVSTISTINHDVGNKLTIEHNNFNRKDLMQRIRRGGVAIVLIHVQKANGRYTMSADHVNSIGHFLIVESINTRKKTVQFAGSTLGMDKVSLDDFNRGWSGWALIIKRNRKLSP